MSEDKNNTSNKSKKGKKRKKKTNIKKIIFSILIFILIIGVGTIGYFRHYLSGFKNNSVDISGIGKKSESIGEASSETNINGSKNILVVGVDIGEPGVKNAPKRTDTMMVAHYNGKTGKIEIVSIPRDTKVRYNGNVIKINAAHAIDGIKGAVEEVEELLGINIDYYAKIDYEGFRQFINAIGGIDMPITRRMDYDDESQNLSIHFKKGTEVHLDGKKAEEFFRWRKNNDGTGFVDGDLGRINNQHLFIEKVVEKCKSPLIITKVPSILDVTQKYVETNMNGDEIIKYGWIFATAGKENVALTTLKGEDKYIGGISYFLYSEKQNKGLIARFNDEEYKEMDRKNIKVKIYNCTKKVGLASDFSSYIQELGYTALETGNKEHRDDSKIIVYGMDKDIVSTIKREFKINNVEYVSSKEENFDIMVLLGEDHNYMK